MSSDIHELEDLENLFDWQIENHTESLFDLHYESLDPIANAFFYDRNSSGDRGSLMINYFSPFIYSNFFLSQSFVEEIEDNDIRAELWYINNGQMYGDRTYEGGFTVVTKYVDPFQENRGLMGTREIKYLIRYADVLLMYAEAIIEMGESDLAIEIIDRVRLRALGQDNFKSVSQYMLEKSLTLKEALMHERRMEMLFEGSRWLDLKRWGQTDVLKSVDHATVIFSDEWPIPEAVNQDQLYPPFVRKVGLK